MLNTTFLRVREDGLPRLRAWLAGLPSRREALRETYEAEGTRHEQFFLLRDGDGPILVVVTELRDRREGGETFLRSDMPLAVEFKTIIQEVADGPLVCEKLYDSTLVAGPPGAPTTPAAAAPQRPRQGDG